MKTLVVSDLHLMSNFEADKADFLGQLFESVDQVILNGDIWDNFSFSFDDFVSSQWNTLFPVLKKKNAIYIYGNHDEKRWSDERVHLFSDYQGEVYNLESGAHKFRIEHGHKLVKKRQPKIYPSLKLRRKFNLDSLVYKIDRYMLNKFGIKYHKIVARPTNKVIKRRSRKLDLNGEILIVGHSHIPEVDLKRAFVNSGFVNGGYANYITIEDGDIVLHEVKY